MHIEQLQLFPTKGAFDSSDFKTPSDPDFFARISSSVFEGFELFLKDNRHFYDKTSKSNMLNNAIAYSIDKNCSSRSFNFISSLSNTRRSFGILDNKYVILFKKSPVSNVKTHQDDLIKYQELNKHVLFLTYELDEFWSEIKKIEFRYYTTPKHVAYRYEITRLTEVKSTGLHAPVEETPTIGIKETAKTRKNVQ